MKSDSMPAPLHPILVKLRAYMHGFYPDQIAWDDSPLAFWELEDDDLYFEALGYLPLFMGEVDDALDGLPTGFRLAYPVFFLEDDYAFNGWTALGNAGDELLARAGAAYRYMAMPLEAQALEAARLAVIADPDDEDAHERAYKSIGDPVGDDDARQAALFEYFRANRHLFNP
jgi:hypothetical protein